MGFDLYGLSPENPKGLVKPEIDWLEEHTDEEKDAHFKKLNEFESEVIGHYFRNNVWYWRPLWNFVTSLCDDFLTDKDMEAGSYNDGHKISKTKARRISVRIAAMDKQGGIDDFEEAHANMRKEADAVNNKLSIAKDKLKKKVKANGHGDIPPVDYPEPYATEWEALQDSEQWAGHYPFVADNVREFARFCRYSGGFEIC